MGDYNLEKPAARIKDSLSKAENALQGVKFKGRSLPKDADNVVNVDGSKYLSIERLRHYLYRVTFDTLPEDNGGDAPVMGGCSSYVENGKLYTNFDWGYDNTASFIVRTRDFEGQSMVGGLNDGGLNDELIEQLPYRIHRGVNNHGIKVATHILFNDWQWTGVGEKNINLTRLPFLILSRVRSMATIEQDLSGVLDNLYCPEGLAALEYLLQVLVTDGTTTYAILPPTSEGEPFVLQDITAYPKLTNFRWVARDEVSRYDMDLQERPTGVERFNAMPCPLEDLRFTLAYESPDRLSEFIGLRDTTKGSTDEELEEIYADARAEYLTRERDGVTWQTVDSAIYGNGMESLWIQENWGDDCVAANNSAIDMIGDLAELHTDHKASTVDAINELAGIIETDELVISFDKSTAELKAIYDLCKDHNQLCREVIFYNAENGMSYVTNGWRIGTDEIAFHVIMNGESGLYSIELRLVSNGTFYIV